MKAKISIVSAMLIILLSLSMSVSAYSQSSPMGFSIRYAVSTDTSFTVTLPSGQTMMNFTGSPGAAYSSVDADGQTDTMPWAKINNTGDLTRNFTIGLGTNNPSNIKLMESDVYAMTGAIELDNTPKIIVGGQDLLPKTEVSVFIKANYSLVPIGTSQVFTNTGTIRNYLPVLQSITVSYYPTTIIYVGDTRTFSAIGMDQFGASMPITPTWASSNTVVGTIDSSGKFKALKAGSTNITATSGTVVGFKVVTVQA